MDLARMPLLPSSKTSSPRIESYCEMEKHLDSNAYTGSSCNTNYSPYHGLPDILTHSLSLGATPLVVRPPFLVVPENSSRSSTKSTDQ